MLTPPDIERDPLTQGFEDGSFDLVLASDVLHAVRDLGAALARAHQLVAPGGMMAFIDISVPPRWADLVFGVTEGWWRFDDSWRQDHAAVDAPTWERVTRAAGFAEVEVLSIGDDSELGSKVVVLARRADAAATTAPDLPAVADPPQDTGDCWLIIGAGTDAGMEPSPGLGDALTRQLESSGRRAVLATRGAAFEDRGAAGFAFCPEDPAQFSRLFATLDSTDLRPSAVINLLALDAPPPEALDAAAMARGEIAGAVGLVHLVQAMIAEGRAPARLAIVTRGTQAVWTPGEAPVNPVAAPVWGLARVVAAEHRALDLLAADLDPAGDSHDAEAAALIAEIDAPDAEREIAFRHASRFANRIRRVDPASIAPLRPENRQSYRLEIPAPGALDRLAFFARDRRPPGPGEVEIEIRAAALNFRDVMKAMGIYPVAGPEDELPGDECAGFVTAVGTDVTHLAPGMAVLAMGPGSLSSHVTLPAALVFGLPQGLQFEAAVTIPVPFLTAWHALHEVGRLRRGETVLIHAATGGVGLAAIQVAQAAGAKVLASAGTPEKRAHLHGLGIEGVMDSRALDFADDVRRLTGGRGVDIVLNALAGRAIETGLAALAPGGRFLEIGKRDIYQNTRVGLRPFRHGLSFTSIDLHQVMTERPSEAARAMRQVIRRVEQGHFRPLPHRVFAMDRAVDAFRHMAQARHLGKIVLSTTDARVCANPTTRCLPLQPRPEATYLISGGLGGFGLELAEGLVAAGARHLVLIGRSGAGNAAARAMLARWDAGGVDVRVEAADITDTGAVADIFARAAASMPPIRGIFHAAMVLDDATLVHLTPEKLARVMAPKVAGGWNLHHSSLGLELDQFVLFSSVAQLVGSQGQGNYVAANAFLVALADHRRALGLPALAVDWGQIADVGHVAERAGIAERLDRIGLGALPVRAAVDALLGVAGSRVSHLALAQIDWQSFGRSMPGTSNSRYDELIVDDDDTAAIGGAGLRERLAAAKAAERAPLVAQVLSELVATVLRATPESIDAYTPMTDQGLDSLMAIDLVMRIEAAFEISLPTSRVGTGLTLRDLTGMVLGLVSGEGDAGAGMIIEESAGASLPARCLVTLREGAEPPLFLIHPGGGRIQAYRALVAALPPGRAVCAITSRSLVDGSAEFATLVEMTAAYAALVAARQPSGAIHLAGFSFGGFAAMALAGALQAIGREVGMIGVIDADPGWLKGDAGVRHRLGQMLADVMNRGEADGYLLAPRHPGAGGDVAALIAELVSMDVDGRTARLINWLDTAGRLGNAATPDLVRTAIHLHLHHASLPEAAPPLPVTAPAIVIASREASGGVEGYRELLPGLCHFERLEVGHFDLLQGDPAVRIAELLMPKTQT